MQGLDMSTGVIGEVVVSQRCRSCGDIVIEADARGRVHVEPPCLWWWDAHDGRSIPRAQAEALFLGAEEGPAPLPRPVTSGRSSRWRPK